MWERWSERAKKERGESNRRDVCRRTDGRASENESANASGGGSGRDVGCEGFGCQLKDASLVIYNKRERCEGKDGSSVRPVVARERGPPVSSGLLTAKARLTP